MNIIEAWKQAKEGQYIERKLTPGIWTLIKTPKGSKAGITKVFECGLPEDFVLAGDWEIVKEKKRAVHTKVMWMLSCGVCMPYHAPDGYGPAFPNFLNKPPMTMTLEWDE